jgi:hypothetical protein
MSDAMSGGFGKFVPGFDFLQNLAKGATEAMPQMPNLANWIAPTLNLEELDKRINELKTVHFWLEQNARALGATVQALEVQKMTLTTLKGMNFNLSDLAQAMTPKAAASPAATAFTPSPTPAPTPEPASVKPAPAPEPTPEPAAAGKARAAKSVAGQDATPAAPGLVDPMQLWGSLTQQFQQIAATAMKDVSRHTGLDTAKVAAHTSGSKGAGKTSATKKRANPSGTTRVKASKPAAKATAKPVAKAAVRRR